MNEFIMTSLRTIEGIDMMAFRQRFGPLKATALIKACGRFIAEHKLTYTNERLFLTVKGMLYADGIAAEFFDLS
jgi:oxygen-independent coproporphyrinogen-3 oxidase